VSGLLNIIDVGHLLALGPADISIVQKFEVCHKTIPTLYLRRSIPYYLRAHTWSFVDRRCLTFVVSPWGQLPATRSQATHINHYSWPEAGSVNSQNCRPRGINSIQSIHISSSCVKGVWKRITARPARPERCIQAHTCAQHGLELVGVPLDG